MSRRHLARRPARVGNTPRFERPTQPFGPSTAVPAVAFPRRQTVRRSIVDARRLIVRSTSSVIISQVMRKVANPRLRASASRRASRSRSRCRSCQERLSS